MRIIPQRLPLVEEQALDDLDQLDLQCGGFLEFAHGLGFAPHVARVPLGPGALAVARLQYPEQGIVVQPLVVVPGQELPVDLLQLGGGQFPEARSRRAEQPALDRNQCAVVDVVLRQGRQFPDLLLGQEAQVDELADVDQHFVTGESRQRLVGRIPVGGRPRGQELPHGQVHVPKPVDERAGVPAQLADAVGPGQGRDVHADACLPRSLGVSVVRLTHGIGMPADGGSLDCCPAGSLPPRPAKRKLNRRRVDRN